MIARPRVTIGVPVFNGQLFLQEALESFLAQTFDDFEVVISDNASTDATEEICRTYAARDERIRYYRSPVNRGAGWNYNRVVELARGDYFKWAAHDDAIAPTFLEKCVAVLDEKPEVVVVFPWLVDVDETGNEINTRQSTVQYDLPTPQQRFRALSEYRPEYTCEEVFGLMRLDVLKHTSLIANYSDSDRTLLAELGLYGPFYEIPEVLFIHRLHKKSSVNTNPGRQERTAWFNPGAAGKLVFPNWRQMFEMFRIIWRPRIPLRERLYCHVHMLTWVKRGRIRLRNDLVWAVKRFV